MNPAKLLFALLPMVSACVKQVNLVVGNRQVVVDCILSEDPQQTLYLSLTNGKSGIGPEALEGAVATLTDVTASQLAGEFEYNSDGCWTLNYAAIPEHSYRLEVEVPGYGTVNAEDTMPPAVDVSYARGRFDLLDAIDTAYFHHYYEVLVQPVGVVYNFEIRSVFYQSASLPEHLLVQGFVYDEESGGHHLSEMICTDSPGVKNVNLSGDTYVSEVMEGDSYHLDDGRTLGRVFKMNPLLDGVSCHSRFLRIEKEAALLQEYFTVSGDFRLGRGFGFFPDYYSNRQTYIPQRETDDYLLLTALSADYARFLDESSFLRRRSESVLISDLYIRNAPFSNIVGGVGIFGATTRQILPVAVEFTIWEEYWK